MSVAQNFAIQCAKTRTAHPSVCALDFEDTLEVTIKHLLGWDTKKRQNTPSTGSFGDLDGCSCAMEERGRKTLHAHLLMWLKDWESVLGGLGELSAREAHVEALLGRETSPVTHAMSLWCVTTVTA